MRFSFVAVTVLGAVASASANLVGRQSSLPSCASACLAKADFGSCQPTDNACLCKSSAFVSSTTTCIQSTCSGSDLQAAESAAQALCAAVGVTLTAPAASASATSPAASSKTATSTAAAASASKSNAAYKNGIDAVAGLAAIGIAALAL